MRRFNSAGKHYREAEDGMYEMPIGGKYVLHEDAIAEIAGKDAIICGTVAALADVANFIDKFLFEVWPDAGKNDGPTPEIVRRIEAALTLAGRELAPNARALRKGNFYRIRLDKEMRISDNPLQYCGTQEYRGETHFNFYDARTRLFHWLEPCDMVPCVEIKEVSL